MAIDYLVFLVLYLNSPIIRTSYGRVRFSRKNPPVHRYEGKQIMANLEGGNA
jgi:hypothetical protein